MREAVPPNHHDDDVDSEQLVVDEGPSLKQDLRPGTPNGEAPFAAAAREIATGVPRSSETAATLGPPQGPRHKPTVGS